MKCIVGCSGFSYKEWKNIFYPEKLPQSKWFNYYCEHFNSLELNVTFYRFPEIKTLKNWYSKSPDEFTFSVKAPRIITHYKKLTGTNELITDFYHNCREGLQEKLGPLLFQFPPTFIYSAENLSKIINSLYGDFTNVVEFRHTSWWNEQVYTQLAKSKIIFCGASHPVLPEEAIVNFTTSYYRFHGIPKLFYSEYSEEKLQNIADAILANTSLKTAYFYFNNTASVSAIKNASWLQEYFSIYHNR